MPSRWTSAKYKFTICRRRASLGLDVAFQQAEHPWVSHNPRLTATLLILRRIGYTLLTIFNNVAQRSDHRRQQPWQVLLTRMHCACGAPSLGP